MTPLRRIAERLRSRFALGREDPTRNRACLEFETDGWSVSQFVLSRLIPAVGVHPFPLNELMLMVATMCRFRPPQLFEWGTHVGKSARVFHEVASHYRIDCDIHSVDLPADASHIEHPGGERGRLVRGLRGVHLHLGDGLDTSLRLWHERGRKAGVLFFVDGDHARDSVKREFSTIVREVPDACVLLHDSFYQSAGSGYNVGPYEAIGEVLASAPGRYRRLDSGLGLPGMTLVYPA